MPDRFRMIASAYLLLFNKGKILLLLRQNTGYEDGKCSLPAGHVEDNESITAALMREINEEIGIKLNPKDIKLVHLMHRKEKDIRIDFFFTADKWHGKISNCEPEKCADLKWFDINKLPENTIPYIRQAIQNYQNSSFYSERGWD